MGIGPHLSDQAASDISKLCGGGMPSTPSQRPTMHCPVPSRETFCWKTQDTSTPPNRRARAPPNGPGRTSAKRDNSGLTGVLLPFQGVTPQSISADYRDLRQRKWRRRRLQRRQKALPRLSRQARGMERKINNCPLCSLFVISLSFFSPVFFSLISIKTLSRI